MFNLSPEIEATLAKPVACAAIGAAIDRFYAQTPFLTQNLAFGASVALGVFLADVTAKHLPTSNMMEKSLEGRALEIGLATGAAFAMDRYMFQSFPSNYVPSRIATIVASEVIGEYLAESFVGVH